MKCDFCFEPEVFRIYASPTQVMQTFELPDGTPVRHESTGGWTACRTCAALIDDADLKGLANRAVDRMLERRPELYLHSREWLLGTIEPIHRQFFELRED